MNNSPLHLFFDNRNGNPKFAFTQFGLNQCLVFNGVVDECKKIKLEDGSEMACLNYGLSALAIDKETAKKIVFFLNKYIEREESQQPTGENQNA
jgi:hypothetical protein